ncbi:MAG: hypothetical protein ABL966_03475 [Acidimicrobiales bacterium]
MSMDTASPDLARTLRFAGAALVLLGGAVHLKLQLDEYGTEDIGRTFALNAIASGLVAAYLVLRADILGPLAGIAVSVGSLIGFALSRIGDGILDFRETGFDAPYAGLTVAAEVAAVLVLVAAGIATRRSGPATATSSPRS